jgi:tetratricopeptide (TPR) repeat protein
MVHKRGNGEYCQGFKEMTADPTRAINVFYSYAQEDAALANELDNHLAAMKRSKQIIGWHNRDIQAGAEWKQEIDEHLNTAQIILLLISPDFMASEYCYGTEMTHAMERHNSGESRVIPIMLRPVDTKGAPFSGIKMLPSVHGPVTSWPNHDEAFFNVAQGIREVVEYFFSRTKEQWLEEGLAHHKAGRYEQSLRAYEQAIQLDQGYARAYRSKGDVLYDLKRYEEALPVYEQALRLDPNHARIHRNKGDILWHLKRSNEALVAYDEAIRLEPGVAQSYNDKGNVFFSLKRYEEALAAFDLATRLDPNSAYAYNNKGNALSRLTRFVEAIGAYEDAIRIDVQYAIPYNNKGRALYHLGRYYEALAAFEQALRLDPDFAGAYNNMADTLERLGRIGEAQAVRAKVPQR